MKQKKLRITQEDFILANRKAARMEEIERHGRQVQSRRMVHKSKKTYDRNRLPPTPPPKTHQQTPQGT